MLRKLRFLASYPRSGNTWTRLLLLSFLRRRGVVPAADDVRDIGKHLPWDTTTAYARMFVDKAPEELTPPEIAELRPKLHRWLARQQTLQPYVKTHSFYGVAYGHPTFDQSVFGGAVYLIRNPLDVAPSLAKHFSYPVDNAIAVMGERLYVASGHDRGMPEPWGSWSINGRSWVDLSGGRVVVVRYEDLVAEPESQFARVLAHLELQATEVEVRAAVADTSLDRLEKLEQTGKFRNPSKQSERFFGVGARHDFTKKLTPEQARAIILAHGLVMERFGYLDEVALDFAGMSREQALASAR